MVHALVIVIVIATLASPGSSIPLTHGFGACRIIRRGRSGGYPGVSLPDRRIKGKVHWILGKVALSTSKDVSITDTAGTH